MDKSFIFSMLIILLVIPSLIYFFVIVDKTIREGMPNYSIQCVNQCCDGQLRTLEDIEAQCGISLYYTSNNSRFDLLRNITQLVEVK